MTLLERLHASFITYSRSFCLLDIIFDTIELQDVEKKNYFMEFFRQTNISFSAIYRHLLKSKLRKWQQV